MATLDQAATGFPTRGLTADEARHLPSAAASPAAQPGRTEAVAALDPDGRLVAMLDESRSTARAHVVFRPGEFVECAPCSDGPTPRRRRPNCGRASRPSATSTVCTAVTRRSSPRCARRGRAGGCRPSRSPSSPTRPSPPPRARPELISPGRLHWDLLEETGIDGCSSSRSRGTTPSRARTTYIRSTFVDGLHAVAPSSGAIPRGFGVGYTGDVDLLRELGSAMVSTSSSWTTSARGSAGPQRRPRPPA